MDGFSAGTLALALITEGFIPVDYQYPVGAMGNGPHRQEKDMVECIPVLQVCPHPQIGRAHV